ARIKKIMRMDDEVGKVAVITPVLISKSLELFLQNIVEESLKETRSRSSKKLSAVHLKRCINANEKFDFLKDVVAKVPDVEEEEVDAPPKRTRKPRAPGATRGRGSGRGRGKKTSSSDVAQEALDEDPTEAASSGNTGSDEGNTDEA
ncbi:hypothetical protein HK096_011091, partial [Nowakowskiella sp. JEL0078]